jgi:hypothetical protein
MFRASETWGFFGPSFECGNQADLVILERNGRTLSLGPAPAGPSGHEAKNLSASSPLSFESLRFECAPFE